MTNNEISNIRFEAQRAAQHTLNLFSSRMSPQPDELHDLTKIIDSLADIIRTCQNHFDEQIEQD